MEGTTMKLCDLNTLNETEKEEFFKSLSQSHVFDPEDFDFLTTLETETYIFKVDNNISGYAILNDTNMIDVSAIDIRVKTLLIEQLKDMFDFLQFKFYSKNEESFFRNLGFTYERFRLTYEKH